MPVDLKDYVDVKERIHLFYERHPEGSLVTASIDVRLIAGDEYVIVQAFAYRDPTDLHPTTGSSWMKVPGSTNFTRGSELENTETSAWGRAIGALGIGISTSIATSNEIANKSGGEVRADVEHGDDGSLIGVVQVGDKASSDFLLRNTPDGPVLGFRLRGDKGGILVRTRGPLAVQLESFKAAAVGQRVTCWGRITTESFRPKGATKDTTYQVLDADRVRVPEVGDLPVITEAPSVPLFDDTEQAAIDAAVDAVLA